MKNLLVGVVIPTRKATCNWCGENDKDCYTATVPLKFSEMVTRMEPQEVRYGGPLGLRKGIELVPIFRNRDHLRYADICTDCVRQLAEKHYVQ